ncbi:MAG: beta-lactamase family protein [Verrucomicrobia bacterium]|nr:beta-lactamase family protein [Verrucomicrobiota bacterium]
MNKTASMMICIAWMVAVTISSTCQAQVESASLNVILEPIRGEFQLPALAAVVVKDSRIVARGAVGLRKADSDATVTPDDKFHIGSCTKSMTATLTAMLVEDGKLTWQTKLADALPEVASSMHPDYRAVTLEQLLAHRAGVPHKPEPTAWAEAWRMRGTPTQQRLEFIRAVLAKPPEAPPGTKYIYSNQGYTAVGAMIEKATGRAWEDLMREKLFTPLGMTSAGFGAPATVGKTDQPWGHVWSEERAKPIPPGPQADNPPAIGPGGTVHCTLDDLAKYAAFHLRAGRCQPALLSAASFEKLHTAVAGQDYAFGWIVCKRGWAGGEALTHNGSNTMFYTVMWLAPRKQFAILIATNIGGKGVPEGCDRVAAALVRKYAN